MKEEQKKHNTIKNHADILLGGIFFLCLVLFLALHILIKDKDLSEQENRSLAKRPAVTAESLTSGTFMSRFETYMADQFPGRNLWRSIDVAFERFGGSREENGVYLGKDGQLMETISVPEAEDLDRTVSSIQSLVKANPSLKFALMIVPDSAEVLKDALPPLARTADQAAMIEDVYARLGRDLTTIDAAAALEQHKDEKLYYKTDQHWTTLGALYAFREYESALGLPSSGISADDLHPATDEYNGTLASVSGFSLNSKETIDVYLPDQDTPVLATYADQQKIRTSLYDTSYLDVKDKYSLFLGGNQSLIDISTGTNSGRTLLLIKDSFANCFIPFLAEQYERIIVADPRYCADTVQDILSAYPVTDVLFLYRGNTFFTDRSIAGFLES